jgi:hypothetical protein
MTLERLHELLSGAGAEVLADLPYLTEAELFGLCLFLSRLAGC